MNDSVHAKSSHTANGVAFRRTFTDIHLSKQIFDAHQVHFGNVGQEILEREKLSGMIPFFEARYIWTNRQLKKSGVNQLFEFAAGLTQRSILFGAAYPEARCVEFDLPEKMEEKRKVVEILLARKEIEQPTNVWFEDGNVIDITAIATAARHFRNEPIAIVNEGLDRYLSQFERTVKLRYFHWLLKHFNGVHITPDIATRTGMAAMRKMRDSMGALGGREKYMEADLGFMMSEHYYDDAADAQNFYITNRFGVKVHTLDEVLDELTSPKRLGLNMDDVREMLRQMYGFVAQPLRNS